jgi:hypothetical protein
MKEKIKLWAIMTGIVLAGIVLSLAIHAGYIWFGAKILKSALTDEEYYQAETMPAIATDLVIDGSFTFEADCGRESYITTKNLGVIARCVNGKWERAE